MTYQAKSENLYLICGLGNYGKEYELTRHNLGYLVVDDLSEKLNLRLDEQVSNCIVGKKEGLVLCKPKTFMNLSGGPLRDLIRTLGIGPENLILVHDDLDLEFSEIRLRWDGGDGGHRGVRSVIENLNSRDFFRLKVGIGRPKKLSSEEYVLSQFSPEEMRELPEILNRASEAIITLVREGKEKAMSIFNRRWKR